MGMAASQARFLGLTARKSNVEYQGQQINQQRTALATESSNLFHQMMTLDVPTPPVTTDFYKTIYTLDESALGNKGDYTIENLTKINNGTNRYTVKLNTIEKTTSATQNTFDFSQVKRTGTEGNYSYTISIDNYKVEYDKNNYKAYQKDTNNNKNVLEIIKNRIYLVDSATNELLKGDEATQSGYSAVLDKIATDKYKVEFPDENYDPNTSQPAEGNTYLYFYQDPSGKNCFITKDQLDEITENAFEDECSYRSGEVDANNYAHIVDGKYMTAYYATTLSTEKSTEVRATIESSSSGRYSRIEIDENETYPSNLSGHSFNITASSKYDEDGYKDAFNDYEFNKNLYQQKISEINSKTEIIQAEDKQLELRLKQLDTEQESIKTEMDSVSKVVQDNIEKSFNAFA